MEFKVLVDCMARCPRRGKTFHNSLNSLMIRSFGIGYQLVLSIDSGYEYKQVLASKSTMYFA